MNTKIKWLWQLPFLTLLVVGTVLIIRHEHNTPYQSNAGLIFGTQYHISYQCDSSIQQSIEAELKRVDREFSMFNKESAVSRFNSREVDPLPMSEMMSEVYDLAKDVNADTDGAFDITVAPLVNAWGFGFKAGKMPSEATLDSLHQLVGMRLLSDTRQGTRRMMTARRPGVMLDFSAIAKGYGVDCVARLLRSRGVKNFMVEIGGEVATAGQSERQQPWMIGVERPVDDSLATHEQLQTVIPITGKALATSGNYRNFYYQGGKKYAHTIDPVSGRPVQHSLLSATVVAPTCAKADAYATSFMVMGLEKAKAVLAHHPELKAFLIYDDNGKFATWSSLPK